MLRLQLQQARPGNHEKRDPNQAGGHAQLRVEQFCAAEPEQDHGQEIGGRANHHVGKPRDDGAEWANEILGRAIGRGNLAEPNPRGHISGRIRDQRQEKQGAGAEEKESKDFIPGGVFDSSGHCGSQ